MFCKRASAKQNYANPRCNLVPCTHPFTKDVSFQTRFAAQSYDCPPKPAQTKCPRLTIGDREVPTGTRAWSSSATRTNCADTCLTRADVLCTRMWNARIRWPPSIILHASREGCNKINMHRHPECFFFWICGRVHAECGRARTARVF